MKIERSEHDASPSSDRSQPTALTCQVPCKVNLFLEVLGKRPDGYHDLDTIMLAVDWCDVLTIRAMPVSQIHLHVQFAPDPWDGHSTPTRFAEDDPAWDIPSDERNLVVRALHRLRSELGADTGLEVELTKRIPAQAGLGGGSADAAAALVLGCLVWSGRLNWPVIRKIAAGLGSDLNFFLEGWNGRRWTARCTGRGEQIQPVPNGSDQHMVIVHPPQGCNTAEIFRNLANQPPQSTEPTHTAQSVARNSAEMLPVLASGQNEHLGPLLYNRLDQVARRCNPWIDRTAKWFDRYKPLGHCLSGSGSASFCLCSNRQEAEKIGRELALLKESRVLVASSWHSPSIQEQAKQLGFDE
jgi:4-diphosphocytidyl-2-C-methyl-D-erythritol kinase